MSNKLFVTLMLTTALVAGCKKDKKDGAAGGGGGAAAPAAAAVKLVEMDVSSAGDTYKGWKVMAPAGAAAKDDFGALSVSDGAGFQLQVSGGAVDMAARKKEISDNDVNKLKRFVTDSPDTLVYESDPGMGGTQFHFLAAVKIGGEDFSCENNKGPTYTQAQIETMVQACKSIKK